MWALTRLNMKSTFTGLICAIEKNKKFTTVADPRLFLQSQFWGKLEPRYCCYKAVLKKQCVYIVCDHTRNFNSNI